MRTSVQELVIFDDEFFSDSGNFEGVDVSEGSESLFSGVGDAFQNLVIQTKVVTE
jgi:hypothetical protein